MLVPFTCIIREVRIIEFSEDFIKDDRIDLLCVVSPFVVNLDDENNGVMVETQAINLAPKINLDPLIQTMFRFKYVSSTISNQ